MCMVLWSRSNEHVRLRPSFRFGMEPPMVFQMGILIPSFLDAMLGIVCNGVKHVVVTNIVVGIAKGDKTAHLAGEGGGASACGTRFVQKQKTTTKPKVDKVKLICETMVEALD